MEAVGSWSVVGKTCIFRWTPQLEDDVAQSYGHLWSAVCAAGLSAACAERVDHGLPLGSVVLGLASDAPSPFVATGDVGVRIDVTEEGWSDVAVRVALGAPGLVTPGGLPTPAVVSPAQAGEVWLDFSVMTGVGEGRASLWWSPRAGLARLPLGGRAGEWELRLAGTDARSDGVFSAAAATLGAEVAAWDEGGFSLVNEQGEVVGAIQLNGQDQAAQVAVFDALWLTDGYVSALRADDGGDLLLQFDAAPKLEGETALLRLNVTTRRVVVPAGPFPVPEDRWLAAVPGLPTDADVEAGRERAIAVADEAERAWLAEVAPRMRQELVAAGCTALDALDPNWSLLFAGYQREIVPRSDCIVVIETVRSQHRRRFRGWLDGRGLHGLAEPLPPPADPSSQER